MTALALTLFVLTSLVLHLFSAAWQRAALGLALILVLALVSACQGPGHGHSEHSATADGAAAEEDVAAKEDDPSSEGVTFFPAYPSDISEEGLDAADGAQQEVVHAHDEDHGEDDHEGHDHGDHSHEGNSHDHAH